MFRRAVSGPLVNHFESNTKARLYLLFLLTALGFSVRPATAALTIPGAGAGFLILNNATVGQSYSSQLPVTGGTAPYHWSTTGTTPSTGLVFDSTGTLSGVPGTPVAQTTYFRVQVTDSSPTPQSTSTLIGLKVTAAPLLVGTATLPVTIVGLSYSQPLQATGGVTPYAWSLRNPGCLTGTGLIFSPAGLLSGVTLLPGTVDCTFRVTDQNGTLAAQSIPLQVSPPVSIVTSPALSPAPSGQSYAVTLTATGGNGGPYAWFVAQGFALPPGLALDVAGHLAGTPTAAGSYAFVIQASDGVSKIAQVTAVLSIYAPLSITSSALPVAIQSVPYSQTLAATGGHGTNIWSAVTSLAGSGLALNATGTLSGTPLVAGPLVFTARVTDDLGNQKDRVLTLTVNAALSVSSSPSLPVALSGQPYTVTFAAQGGTGGPYTWTPGSTLPAGLSLSSGGVLQGTPSTSGNQTFAITANDGVSPPAQLSASVLVFAPVTLAASPNPSAFGQSLKLTATVSPPAGASPAATGLVTFQDGQTTVGSATLVNGTATLSILSLAVGTHSITALYAGDSAYPGSHSAATSQTVTQAVTSIMLGTPNPALFGQSVLLTATVTPATATGLVTFGEGSTVLGTGILSNGVATLSVSTLSVASHSLTAAYPGDSNDLASTSAAVTVPIGPATTSATLTVSLNPSAFGQPVTLTATVAPVSASGVVTFGDGANTLGTGMLHNGVATLTVSTLSVASHTLTAAYAGDTNDAPGLSASLLQMVNRAASTLTLMSFPNPSFAGQPVTLTAAASPAGSTGTVTFLDGAATLGQAPLINGTASFPVSTLLPGNRNVSASYSGDNSYQPSSGPLNGPALTFSAAVPGTVSDSAGQGTGFLTRLPGTGSSLPDSDPNLTLNTSAGTLALRTTPSDLNGAVNLAAADLPGVPVPNGDFTLSATFRNVRFGQNSDQFGLFAGLSASSVFRGGVNFIGGVPGTFSAYTSGAADQNVQFSPNLAPNNGDDVTLTLTRAGGVWSLGLKNLTSPANSGVIPLTQPIFLNGVTGLVAGVFGLNAGNSTVRTETLGSFVLSGGFQTVNQIPTTTTVISSPNPTLLGNQATLTATVTPSTATGTVTFRDGSSDLGTGTVHNGVATYSSAALTVGTHIITAMYGGDIANGGSASLVYSLTVTLRPVTISLNSSLNPSAFGQNVTITATLSAPFATGNVTFRDGGATLGSAPVSGGVASFSSAGFTAGQHAITASYSGDATYGPNASSALTQTATQAPATVTLTSGANPAQVTQPLTLTASVTPSTATGQVTFRDGPNAIATGTVSAGSASASVSLPFGPHPLTAVYGGDQNTTAATSGVLAQHQAYPPLLVTTSGLPAGQTGQPYGPAGLAASGGSGIFSWAATGLPQGLVISPAGSLSGTPADGFTGSVRVTVTDTLSNLTASATYTLSITFPALTLTGPATLGSVVAGGAISGTFTAAGGKTPYTWNISGAPGVAVDANGKVSGTAGGIGTFSAVVTVTDSRNTSISRTATLAGFGITSSGLPPASTTSDYSASLTAAGGTQPYTFSVSGLPEGISFSGNAFGGRPLNPGNANVTVQARDSAGLSVSASYTLAVTGPTALQVFSTSLGDATVGQSYNDTLNASGGTTPYKWSRSGGVLPAGLSLDFSGALTGQATTPGAFALGVQVVDASGNKAVGTVNINVKPAPLTITNGATFPAGIVGSDYPAQFLNVTGGVPPYSFTLKGSLPAGLSLSGSQLGGIPTAAADSSFTLMATDSAAVPSTGLLGASISVRALSPDLVLAAASASFSVTAGATVLPAATSIGVSSSAVTQVVTFTTSATVPWLTASGGSTTPGIVSVGLNSAALALLPAGSPYAGTVTVVCASTVCSGKSQVITVSLTVTAPAPQLSLGTTILSFASLATNPQPSTAALTLLNIGGGILKINAVTSDSAWLSVGAFAASVPAGASGAAAITVSPSGLAAGYYRGSISVTSSGGNASAAVTLFISAAATMSLGPAGAQFSLPQGGALGNGGGSFSISVSGDATVPYTAGALGGAGWLSVTGGSGTATASNPGTVSLAIDPSSAAALAPGAYYGTIRVSGSGVVNATQDFQVVLNVTPAATPVIPDPQPAGLVFVSAGTGALATQTVSLYASSRMALPFQASASTDSGQWLSISATQGTASATTPGNIVVSASATGLSPGAYRGAVSFAFGSAVRAVNVTLIVVAPVSAAAGAAPAPLVTKAAAAGPLCANALLVPTQTGLVSNFSAPTAWPTQLAVRLFDTCGSVIGNGQLVATFSNGDPPLPLTAVSSGSGLYSGTWTPRKTSNAVTITASATVPGYPGAAVKIGGQVAPNAAPVLAPNATGDIFHPQVGAGLGPGNIVQIYGSGLAGQASAPATLPLPTSMGGTSVIIGGVAAPLFYVSPDQINAQIPFELTAGNQYQVIVSANGALTTPQPIQLNGGTPSILNFVSGAVVAQHLDGTLIQDSAPAVPGEFVVIYSSGLGATDIPVPSGTASPSDPPARVADPPVLTLNGNQVNILFAGLAPGFVGLYQLNFQIPPGIKTGNYDLLLTQSGIPSNDTVIAVKAPPP